MFKWLDNVFTVNVIPVMLLFLIVTPGAAASASDNSTQSNAQIKNIKKTASFFQQQEKKRLFNLAKLYSKNGAEFLKVSAKFSSNPIVRKRQINEWKGNFYKLNSPEMKSFSSGVNLRNYQLSFIEEWKTIVNIHDKWIQLVESYGQERQPASSSNSIKLLLIQTENLKKRTAKLTVW